MNWDDVRGRVVYVDSSLDQLPPEVAHILPVPGSQGHALFRLQDLDALDGSGQVHGGQGGGEDEPRAVASDHIYQARGASNESANVTVGFTCVLQWGLKRVLMKATDHD